MVQQTTRQQMRRPLAHPKRRDIFLHGIKTSKLVGQLLIDPRVPITRKVLFIGSVGALVLVLFFPDLIGETILSTIFPLVGTVLGVPIDAGFDWVAFALVVVSLLRFFPPELVSEHYNNVFKRGTHW
jgi:hypothetical protein